jgi:hypothetical protein
MLKRHYRIENHLFAALRFAAPSALPLHRPRSLQLGIAAVLMRSADSLRDYVRRWARARSPINGGEEPFGGLVQSDGPSGRGIDQQAEWIKGLDVVYITATAQSEKHNRLGNFTMCRP